MAFSLASSISCWTWVQRLGTALTHMVARLLHCAISESQTETPHSVPTEDLITRFQKGQPRAFEALYDRYKDYVYRVAFFVTRNASEAEDAVQETFLDVHKALPHYDVDGPARFKTWLYRVTVNRCRMRMRRKRPPSVDWEKIDERLAQLPSPRAAQPESVVTRREQASALWQAVDCLPDPHRMVLLLRYKEELSYNEIADVLSLRLGTVKSRLYNAHKKLKALLETE